MFANLTRFRGNSCTLGMRRFQFSARKHTTNVLTFHGDGTESTAYFTTATFDETGIGASTDAPSGQSTHVTPALLPVGTPPGSPPRQSFDPLERDGRLRGSWIAKRSSHLAGAPSHLPPLFSDRGSARARTTSGEHVRHKPATPLARLATPILLEWPPIESKHDNVVSKASPYTFWQEQMSGCARRVDEKAAHHATVPISDDPSVFTAPAQEEFPWVDSSPEVVPVVSADEKLSSNTINPVVQLLRKTTPHSATAAKCPARRVLPARTVAALPMPAAASRPNFEQSDHLR